MLRGTTGTGGHDGCAPTSAAGDAEVTPPFPREQARASHHTLAEFTRIADATSSLRSTEYGASFFSEVVLERLAQDAEDIAAEP